MTKKYFIQSFLIFLIVISIGCTNNSSTKTISSVKSTNTESTKIQNVEPIIGNKKGNKAIDFTIITTEGRKVSLKDYEDNKKPLLIYFWATWCPFCERDFANVKNIYHEYKNDVGFLAVDLDVKETPDDIKRYINSRGLNDIEFASGDPRILTDYSIKSTTTKFAISREGIILWTGSGVIDENTWRIIFEGLKKS